MGQRARMALLMADRKTLEEGFRADESISEDKSASCRAESRAHVVQRGGARFGSSEQLFGFQRCKACDVCRTYSARSRSLQGSQVGARMFGMQVRRKSSFRKWPSRLSRILWRDPECPLCTSIMFRRSPPRALRDGLLRLVNLAPLQCTNCWKHFYWFQSGNSFVEDVSRH
jgi:hypothetical protein